jgi:multicomponent Na+:H+ antiporter subunit E
MAVIGRAKQRPRNFSIFGRGAETELSLSAYVIDALEPLVRGTTMFKRLVIFSLLWWLLTGGNLNNWPVGVFFILISTLMSSAATPSASWSAIGFIGFVPFFLWHSLKGGLDVAARTFNRSLPLNPSVLSYRLRLPLEPARLFFANTINLLPGTLCADLDDHELTVHVLDTNSYFRRELESLEDKVAKLFRVSMPSQSGE